MISSRSQVDHFICLLFSQVFAMHQVLIHYGGGRLPQIIPQLWGVTYKATSRKALLLNCSSVPSREKVFVHLMCTIIDLFLFEIESFRRFRKLLGLCISSRWNVTVGEIAVAC